MPLICGLDPGNVRSAYTIYNPNNRTFIEGGKVLNHILLDYITTRSGPLELVCEKPITYMGKMTPVEVIETAYWSGRFCDRWATVTRREFYRMSKPDISYIITGKRGANDAMTRAALVGMFGNIDDTVQSFGRRNKIKEDIWDSAAAAVAYSIKKTQQECAAKGTVK